MPSPDYKKECGFCGDIFRQLGMHLRVHGLNTQAYYDRFLRRENEGTCRRCDKPSGFLSMDLGYGEFCGKRCWDAIRAESRKQTEKRKKVEARKRKAAKAVARKQSGR